MRNRKTLVMIASSTLSLASRRWPSQLPRHRRTAHEPGASGGVIREAKRRRRLRLLLRFAVVGLRALRGHRCRDRFLGGRGSDEQPRGPTEVRPARVDPEGGSPCGCRRHSTAGRAAGASVVLEGSGGIAGGGCGALPVRSRPIVTVLSTASAKARQNSVGRAHHARRRVAARERLPAGAHRRRAGAALRPAGGPRRAPAPRQTLAVGQVGVRRAGGTQLGRAGGGRPTAPGPSPEAPARPGRDRRRPLHADRARSGGSSGGSGATWRRPSARAPTQLVGRAFFSCVDVEYYLHSWPLDAAVLLDAAHPGSLAGRHPRPDSP